MAAIANKQQNPKCIAIQIDVFLVLVFGNDFSNKVSKSMKWDRNGEILFQTFYMCLMFVFRRFCCVFFSFSFVVRFLLDYDFDCIVTVAEAEHLNDHLFICYLYIHMRLLWFINQ